MRPSQRNLPKIDLEDLTWEECGDHDDPKARLLAQIVIAGTSMHLEAWEVEYISDIQYATAATHRGEDFDTLCDMMDCCFQTTMINGREYVLVATPHGL